MRPMETLKMEVRDTSRKEMVNLWARLKVQEDNCYFAEQELNSDQLTKMKVDLARRKRRRSNSKLKKQTLLKKSKRLLKASILRVLIRKFARLFSFFMLR
ncbi:hypothetical protein VNO78_28542 [Psophocarpus tetragonolobus]|uniref:Uncharacterized protein n=1 Tax=Psophocarpus tetragonolobus TaxID=3891 RepID=A0AAN9S2S7_PSOTE